MGPPISIASVTSGAIAIVLAVIAVPAFGQDEVAARNAEARSTAGGVPCIAAFNGTNWDCIPVRPKTIFVTSTTYDGDLATGGMGLNGLQGADNICDAHAVNGAVPPGDYVAWLSTDDKHARDRLPANGVDYVLPDGSRIADSKSALLNAENVSLRTAINQDEFGATVDRATVWTGSSSDGIRHWSGYNCYDWTFNGGGVEAGTAGETTYVDGRWSATWSVICAAKLRLYCIQR